MSVEVEVVCSICTDTITDAAELKCGHAYCFKCIDGHLQRATQGQGTCPLCRKPAKPSDVTRNSFLERVASNLTRPCSHAAHGCTYTGRRDELRDHEKDCPKAPAGPRIAALRAEYDAKLAEKDAALKAKDDELKAKEQEISRVRSERGEAEAKLQAKLNAAQQILAERAGCSWGRVVKDDDGKVTVAFVRYTDTGDEYEIKFGTQSGSSDVSEYMYKTRGFKPGVERQDRSCTVTIVHPANPAEDHVHEASCTAATRPGTGWGREGAFCYGVLKEAKRDGHYFVGVV